MFYHYSSWQERFITGLKHLSDDEVFVTFYVYLQSIHLLNAAGTQDVGESAKGNPFSLTAIIDTRTSKVSRRNVQISFSLSFPYRIGSDNNIMSLRSTNVEA